MDRRISSPEASSSDLLLRESSESGDTNSRWRDSKLDEAMEGIVHPKSDKFSLSELRKNEKGYVGIPKYDEEDYQMHRAGGYQHHPSSHRSHHHKRRPSQQTEHDDGGEDYMETPSGSNSPPTVPTSNETSPVRNVGSFSAPDPLRPPLATSASLDKPLRPSLKKTSTVLPPIDRLQLDKNRCEALLGRSSPSSEPLLSKVASKVRLPDVAVTEPLMSERAGRPLPETSTDYVDKAKVKFQLGAELAEEDEHDEDGSKKHHQCHKERHEGHSRHHHHHHHKRRRQRLGSDVEMDNYFHRAVEPDEAELLPTADLEEIASRRFEDPKGIRRHKIQAKSSVSSFIHPSKKDVADGKVTLPFVKKIYDHQPHEIFVELDELLPGEGGDDLEWRETARWIKYEENAQEGMERWGKPHVASLSFHSLLSLRKCLEQGTVLLDLEERDVAGISYKVVENMVLTDQLHPDNQGAVMRALLLRHRHVHERSFTAGFNMKRNNSGYGSLNLLSHDKNKSPKLIPANGSFPGAESKENGMAKLSVEMTNQKNIPEIRITMEDGGSRRPSQDMEKIFRNSSTDDLPHFDTSILRRIPEGAEATTVLVGALDFLEQPTIAFVRLSQGVIMPNIMEVSIPVRFIFVLLGPIDTDLDYHEIGRSISTLMANTYFHDVAYRAEDRKDLLRAINEFLDDSIVLPPGDWERNSLLPIHDIRRKSMELRNRKKRDEIKKEFLTAEEREGKGEPPGPGPEPGGYDPLKRSGCVFGGLMNDVKQRYPWYISDLLDGLNGQCFAAAVFIYFAALSGAITFGGLMGDKTNNLIGVSETLIVTSVCGVLFALLSGQPLIIIGATGPLLLYDEILFQFCEDNSIEYLPMRVWIGIWFALISTICVATESSALVRFFTRFTQEIFASLISLLYIYECIIKVVNVFEEHPLIPDYCLTTNGSINSSEDVWVVSGSDSNITMNVTSEVYFKVMHPSDQPNTALLSLILTVGTFFIAYFLRQFRNSKFLGRSARRALGDFGVPIAIILMVSLGYICKSTYTQKLSVPEGLTPSNPEARGWVISPLGMEYRIAIWHIFAAGVAALLLFILVFLETEICELIMFKKDRKLRKGSGFHLDLLLLGYLQLATGVVGGPWLCAATVRSVSHLASLTVMSRTHAPGQAPFVIDVKEQRLTSLLVALMIGISVMMAPLLRQVPVACLFGVFLYMGVSSMSGIHLFDRMYLLFMPVKHHPDLAYVRKVRTWKMHAYTLVQLAALGVLWVVKSTEAALAFPFVLLMMVPLRLQLKFFFTQKELQALDGEEQAEDKKEDEPDFYQQIVP